MLSYGAFHAAHTLQYVHNSLIVGYLSDRSINPSKGVVAYGIKGTRYFNAMVGFYLNGL